VIELPRGAVRRDTVPGLSFRAFRGAEDYPAMAAVNMAARLAAGVEEIVTVEMLAAQYAHLTNSDVRDDLRIVELRGEPVGYVRVEWSDQTDGSRSYEIRLLLRPELRDGPIDEAMMDWAEARIAQIAGGHPADRPRWYGALTWDADLPSRAMLAERGYEPVRTFFDMIRPDLDVLPAAPLPEGFEIRPVSDAQMRAVWEAEIKAFRDHWGGVEDSEDDFQRLIAGPSFDPTLHVVAFAGDEIAGAVRNEIDDAENALFDRRRGLLDSVFVRRPYRRRGLARALIVASLALLRERGMTSAWLGVDGDNVNAAFHLYESCGFERGRSTTSWRRPIEPGTGGPR
jgi:ribosomal protein S18 acetylase RimI-like enzyme